MRRAVVAVAVEVHFLHTASTILRFSQTMDDERTAFVDISRVTQHGATRDEDLLAVEEPLEIRVAWQRAEELREQNLSVTMRTPGCDEDLAAGFLFTEGLVRTPSDIEEIRHWGSPNIVRILLAPGARIALSGLARHFYMTSSCGVCGKSSIDAVRLQTAPRRPVPLSIEPSLICRLPLLLEQHQSAFRRTGGLHGAAIFSAQGSLLRIREDIGRHNAVDKVIGSFVREGLLPPANSMLMVSSRGSFELVQKAVVAGIPLLATVGAPSTLAVELARDCGVTLLGFVRDGRFNVYAGQIHRARRASAAAEPPS